MDASVQDFKQPPLRSQAPKSPTSARSAVEPPSNTTARAAAGVFAMALAVVVVSATAWGWLLVQFIQLFVRPELSTLREQVAGLTVR